MDQVTKVLTYKGQVVFEKVCMPDFNRVPKVYQKNEACFIFVNEGEFSLRTPEEMVPVSKSNGILAKCLDYFFESSPSQRGKANGFEVIGVYLHQSLLEELFDFDVSHSKHKVDYNVKQFEIDNLLDNFRNGINILIDNPDLADEDIVKIKLKEFILLISKTQDAPQSDFLSSLFKTKQTEFTEIVNNNVFSNLSVEELAHLCSMSVSTFKRKFNEEFDESPKKYMSKMRLQRASEMLISKESRISDVAYELGYDTVSTFNRSFKKHFGKSPTEFKLG